MTSTLPMTRRGAAAAILALAAAPALSKAATPYPVVGKVERLDPALDALVDADAPVEQVMDGFTWSEGPVWVGGKDGYLLVSDVPGNRIHRWSPARGDEIWLAPSGYAGPETGSLREAGSNGLIVARGGLVIGDSGNRCVSFIDLKTRKKTVLAASFEGKRLNSPNDLVLARDGAIYFTDPPWGLKGDWSSPYRQTDYSGVYRLGADNVVTLIDKTIEPNGIGLSPDGKTLYGTDRKTGWVAWDLDAKGAPTARRSFVDRATTGIDGGDGLKVDRGGNLWASSQDGISIFTPAGQRIGIIRADDVISNCELAADGHLYMSSNHRVLRVKVKARKLAA
ncbi:SMP-30/gluconolactonase/LRE family protein [Caulobacter soli]|uniref:SMP-30/gluconolactonase/LRE family protein n=1 Tax=Caulobacter soli TaxID=2708539 RepID=UPI0013EC9384|nr:SMP-30/gluconolactonase/LRE family protein [Caulobacter soli]